MARFDFLPTPLAGLVVVQRKAIEDHRGFLSRLYCADEFRDATGVSKPISQINQTLTRTRGAVRGFHFQHAPFAECKLVSCTRGEVFDVAVDLRRGSPTFLRWHGVRLSPANRTSLWIPEGFAHGFQALHADCEMLYLHTAPYRQESEGAVNVADARLAVEWPLPIAEMSERDRNHKMIDDNFEGIGV